MRDRHGSRSCATEDVLKHYGIKRIRNRQQISVSCEDLEERVGF